MYWHKRSRVCARRGSYLVIAFGGGYFGGFHEGKFYGAGAVGAVGSAPGRAAGLPSLSPISRAMR